MAVEILKRGELPAKQVFMGSCFYCKTEVRCAREDGVFSSDQRDGDMLKIDCPVCHHQMWAYPKRA